MCLAKAEAEKHRETSGWTTSEKTKDLKGISITEEKRLTEEGLLGNVSCLVIVTKKLAESIMMRIMMMRIMMMHRNLFRQIDIFTGIISLIFSHPRSEDRPQHHE